LRCAIQKPIRPLRAEFRAFPATLVAMITIIKALLGSIFSAFRTRRNLVLENLALRYQLTPAPHPSAS
jgi:hypothetical protein